MRPLVSLVIPTYNGVDELPETLRDAQAYFGQQSYLHEIIVINDGSQDRTAATLEALATAYPELVVLTNASNMGKGFSTKRGILESNGRYVFYTDVDLSYPLEALESFLKPLTAAMYDVSVGSRVHDASVFRLHPRYFRYVYRRHLMSRLFNWVVRTSLGLHVMDTQCGFKGFSAEVAKAIFSQVGITGFAFDVEVLLIAQRLGLKVIEIPVTCTYNGQVSTVKVMRYACQALVDLARISWWNWHGKYEDRHGSFLRTTQ
jgi:dolichyl-phosphate beta-glucosyltransferase